MTRSELLDLVYRFYPRRLLDLDRIYVPAGEPVYEDTEEHRRLVEAANRGRREYPTWKAMIGRLGERYRLQDESICLLANWVIPGYSAHIWTPGETALSFHVSLLGPYYGIHCRGVPQEESTVREIVREIEATYSGYQAIPPELGNEVVPDVDARAPFGEATIYVCLFSEVWTRMLYMERSSRSS